MPGRYWVVRATLVGSVLLRSIGLPAQTTDDVETIQQVAARIQELRNEDAAVRRQAAAALQRIGRKAKDAVPALIEALRDRDSMVASAANRALEAMGPDAAAAAPALVAELDGRRIVTMLLRFDSEATLVAIGGAAVPALSAALQEPSEDRRLRALEVLARMGVAANAAAAAVANVSVTDPNESVRAEALRTLYRLGSPPTAKRPAGADGKPISLFDPGPRLPAEVTRQLLAALGDGSDRVRAEAARTLSQIQPPAADTLTALGNALKDRSVAVRTQTAGTLASFGEASGAVVPALIEALRDTSESVRLAVCEALTKPGLQAKAAVPGLVAALNDGNAKVRERAGTALVAIGSIPEDAVAQVIAASRSEDTTVRRTAFQILAKARPSTPQITAVLLNGLKDEDEYVRESAIAGLEPGGAAISALISMIQQSEGRDFVAAADKIAKMGASARDAIPALIEALAKRELGSGDAAKALAAIGPEANAALIGLLESDAAGTRNLAYWTLARTGEAGLGTVIQAARSGTPATRVMALEALPLTGPGTLAGVAVLIEALKDPAEDIRKAAATRLGLVNPGSAEIRSALYSALEDPSEPVWRAAAAAMGYSGRETLAWIVSQVRDSAEPARRRAVEALGRVREAEPYSGYPGPPSLRLIAMPALIEALQDSSEAVRRGAAGSLGGYRESPEVAAALRRAVEDGAKSVRVAAAFALVRAGAKEEKGSVVLAEELRAVDLERRRAAAEAIGWIGPVAPAASQALISALKDEAAPVRRAAAFSLMRIGQAKPEAVPELLAALRDGNADERTMALGWLEKFEILPEDASARLLELSRDPSYQNRAAAIPLLARQASEKSVSAIVERLNDPESWVRSKAVEAIAAMDPVPEAAVPGLVSELKTGGSYSHRTVIQPLVRVARMDNRARSALIDALWDDHEFWNQDVIDAVAQLGGTAVGPLIAGIRSKPGVGRVRAITAIGRIGPEASEAVPFLVTSLKEFDEPAVLAVTAALGAIGPPAAPAVDALIGALGDESAGVRANAARALGAIGPEARAAVRPLIAMLDYGQPAAQRGESSDQRSEIRRSAVEGLIGIGTAAVPALLDLHRASRRQSSAGNKGPSLDYYEADEWMWRISKSYPDAEPLFVEALKDDQESLRMIATRALGASAELSAEGVRGLRKALHDPSRMVGRKAIGALGEAGERGKEGLEDLIAMAWSPEESWRLEILSAVRQIAEGLQNRGDVSKNAVLKSGLVALTSMPPVSPGAYQGPKWSDEVRLLRRSVDALDTIEKQILVEGRTTEGASGTTIEDLDGVNLSGVTIRIEGKTMPASVLLTRGTDNRVRIKQSAGAIFAGRDGAVAVHLEYKNGSQWGMLLLEQARLSFFRPFRTSYALVIAISNYPSGSGYRSLPYAERQASRLASDLQAQGFDVRTLYGSQATRENIRSALGGISAQSQDRLFVYFGGHGDDRTGFDKMGYIVPYDATQGNLRQKGIALEELRLMARQQGAKQTLFALDSCQSGLVAVRGPLESMEKRIQSVHDIETMSRANGITFLTAGTGAQPALDANGGFFTEALIEAVEGGIADVPLGVVDIYRLISHIRLKVNHMASMVGRRQEPGMEVARGDAGWVFVVGRPR